MITFDQAANAKDKLQDWIEEKSLDYTAIGLSKNENIGYFVVVYLDSLKTISTLPVPDVTRWDIDGVMIVPKVMGKPRL